MVLFCLMVVCTLLFPAIKVGLQDNASSGDDSKYRWPGTGNVTPACLFYTLQSQHPLSTVHSHATMLAFQILSPE